MGGSSVTPSELQNQHPDEKRQSDFQNHFWAYLVVRPLSFYIAPVFIRLGFGATHVTAIGAFVLISGLALFGFGGSLAPLVGGALLINIWYLLDFVDGVVARYNDTTTAFGAFLDWFVGVLYHVLLPFAAAAVLYRSDMVSLTEGAGILWFTIATVEVVFRLVRWLVRYKTEQLIDRNNCVSSTKQGISLGMLAGAVSSFKAPLFLLSVMAGVLDIWLLVYAVYSFGLFTPELLIYIRRLRRFDQKST